MWNIVGKILLSAGSAAVGSLPFLTSQHTDKAAALRQETCENQYKATTSDKRLDRYLKVTEEAPLWNNKWPGNEVAGKCHLAFNENATTDASKAHIRSWDIEEKERYIKGMKQAGMLPSQSAPHR